VHPGGVFVIAFCVALVVIGVMACRAERGIWRAILSLIPSGESNPELQCPMCKGQGWLSLTVTAGSSYGIDITLCKVCDGTGRCSDSVAVSDVIATS
jgi:hypothetical protein